jgi:Integrase core domain.
LEEFGCGDVSGIRKYVKRNGIEAHTRMFEGNPTAYYAYDALKPTWRAKIDANEATEREARERGEIQAALKDHGIEPPPTEELPFGTEDIEAQALAYSDAPDYNRRKFEKYGLALKFCNGYEGQALRARIGEWNAKRPSMQTSYPAVMKERKKVKERGQAVLLGQFGNRKGASKTEGVHQEYFNSLYLKQGGPSAESCRRQVAGKYGINLKSLPSADTFLRRIYSEVGVSAIYMAREGFAKWNRKYGQYIDRDYSKIKTGEVWVSDHAQIDVAVKGKNGKVVFGWVTSFIDMKTGKALAVLYHEDAPNSDHIFQAFFLAVEAHGLCKYVYIDNGKDFRCRDFAGGRTYVHRVQVDEGKAGSMLCALGITPIFAQPYNAQAKVIERWHLKIKNDLSKHAEGYRGGNVTERPERLADDIKHGRILDFDTFNGLLCDFIFKVLNKMPSQGKGCKGVSPDDAWNSENPVKRTVTRDALKLFCMRTTKPLTIGRNGIKHSKFDVTYFSDWMIPRKGTKVYLRIAPDNVNDAWVFDETTDEYLGNASIKGLIHPVAETEIDRSELREALASKKRDERLTKELGLARHTPDTAERLSNMKAAVEMFNPAPVPEPERIVSQILPNSAMQQAVNARKQQERRPEDLGGLAHATEIKALERKLEEERGRLLRFECEKPVKEQRIRDLEQQLEMLKAVGQ